MQHNNPNAKISKLEISRYRTDQPNRICVTCEWLMSETKV